jgi:glycosyltransferase involved in cell wall biosynthesis
MSEMRHILLVNVFFAPFSYGGATVVAEQVAYALLRRGGVRISAISLVSRTDLAPYAIIRTETSGIVNYLINVPPGRDYAQIYDNSRVTERIAQLMDELDLDLVHVHCVQDVGAGFLQAAKDRGLPLVLSVHDFWWICDRQFMVRVDNRYCGQFPVRIEACRDCVEDFAAARQRFEHLQRQGALADIVTYPSRFARDLSEASGFAPGRGVVWENGVRLPGPDFFKAQEARRAADPRLVFGFVGGPSEIKGWPVIRRAFTGLDRSDFCALLVDGARDGGWWDGYDLSQLPGDWQVYPRFEQPEMDDYYARIDVLLFMSQWKETFGLAIREALARGIKVIQTDSGGTTEHGAIPPDRLIPIGAGPEALRPHLEEALAAHPDPQAPRAVASFDDQAKEFAELVTRLTG